MTLTDVKGPPEREVDVEVRLDPADAADDAYWFETTAWQGKADHSPVAPMEEVSPGVWRSTEPLPVHGDWKSTLRLHKGFAVQGLAIYFPEDKAIPVKAVPAEPQFTREFQRDKKLLQREQKPGVSRLPDRRRLPDRAADLPRPLRRHGLGPGAAAEAAKPERSAGVTAAGPRASGARSRPTPATP